MPKKVTRITVAALKHGEATRRNIPTAEFQSVMGAEEESPIRVAYERRNRDLDPQLVWRGKDYQDWSDLVVQAPPLYIQEKIQTDFAAAVEAAFNKMIDKAGAVGAGLVLHFQPP